MTTVPSSNSLLCVPALYNADRGPADDSVTVKILDLKSGDQGSGEEPDYMVNTIMK